MEEIAVISASRLWTKEKGGREGIKEALPPLQTEWTDLYAGGALTSSSPQIEVGKVVISPQIKFMQEFQNEGYAECNEVKLELIATSEDSESVEQTVRKVKATSAEKHMDSVEDSEKVVVERQSIQEPVSPSKRMGWIKQLASISSYAFSSKFKKKGTRSEDSLTCIPCSTTHTRN